MILTGNQFCFCLSFSYFKNKLINQILLCIDKSIRKEGEKKIKEFRDADPVSNQTLMRVLSFLSYRKNLLQHSQKKLLMKEQMMERDNSQELYLRTLLLIIAR